MTEAQTVQPNWAPSRSEGPNYVLALQGLALVLGIFFIAITILRKVTGHKGGISSRKLSVVERLPLSQKTTLLLIQHDGREVLCAVGNERVTFLSEMGKESPEFAIPAEYMEEEVCEGSQSPSPLPS